MLLPELRQFCLIHGADLVFADEHLAAGGLFQPGQLIQQGRLAAAGLADDAAKLAFFNCKIHVIQRYNALFSNGVDLAQLFGMYDGCQEFAPFKNVLLFYHKT